MNWIVFAIVAVTAIALGYFIDNYVTDVYYKGRDAPAQKCFFVLPQIVIGVLFIGLFLYGIQPYVVESGSMEPAIKIGSVCFINRKADYNEMHEGDIIAFKINDKKFATHRIKSITDEGFETKGDANSGIDGIITTRDNFLGKNVFSIPNVGFIVKSIQTPSGKIVLGTIVIVLFLAGILIGEPSKKKKDTE